MSAPKLTPTQAELLEAMRKGAICHYMRYAGRFNPTPYYFRSDSMKRCTAAAGALLKKGLVERVNKGSFGDHTLRFPIGSATVGKGRP